MAQNNGNIMKILIDLLSTQYGGGEIYILNQLKALKKICNTDKFVILCSIEELKQKLDGFDYTTILFKRNNYFPFKYICTYNYLLMKHNIDLIYSPNNFINPFAIKPSIVLFQNVKVFGYGIDKSSLIDVLKYKIISFLAKFSFYHSKCNIFVSQCIMNLSYRPRLEKNVVIYSGNNYTIIENNVSKENYILTVSTSGMGHKNIGIQKEALSKISIDNIKLLIAGKIDDTSEDNENIKYLGYIDNKKLKEYYLKAKLFINTSKHESFGFTPMEAMACGTPCIISDIPVFREIYGNSALYFNPNSSEELADKIELLLSDDNLYNDMINRGYKQIEKFSWDKNAKQLLEIIRKRNYSK